MSRFRREIVICLLLVGTNLVVFGQIVTHDFVTLDDYRYVVENPKVRTGLTWEGFIWAFETGFHRHWHPLTWLSHMADCQLFGLNPGGPHLVNLLLHSANTLLLFFMFLRMTRSLYPSALVAVLFAVHPLHVETAAWVADRKDLLSAFFWFLTILTYVGYCHRPKVVKFVLVFIFMAMGVLCKSSIMTLPFTLLLLDYWPLGRLGWGQRTPEDSVRFARASLLKVVAEKIPLFLLCAGAVIGAYITIDAPIEAPVERGSFGPNLSTTPRALWAYLVYVVKTFWPYHLAAPYPHPRFTPLPGWKIGVAVLPLAAISAISIRQVRKRPYLIVGWLFFLGNLLPVVGLFNIGPDKMADRYTYIPLIGLFIMVVFYLNEQIGRIRLPRVAVAAVSTATVLALMGSAFLQTRHWKDSVTLFTHALQVTQKNELAHNNLGIEYMHTGDTQTALQQFQKALALRPTYLNALVNVGVLFQRQGNLKEAKMYYSQSLKNRPDYAPAHYNLGRALEEEGNYDRAEYHYKQAVKFSPDDHQSHNNLGVLMAKRGRFPEAVQQFREALKIQPQDAQALNNLGGALQKTGKIREAKYYYQKAIGIEPDNAFARFNLAGILEIEGNFEQAVSLYQGILSADPRSPNAYLGLGRVAETQGELIKALDYYQKALQLKPGFHPAQNGRKRVLEKIGPSG